MRWLIASDIHGSAKYCGMLLERFKEERADRMILLGDLLYHGPRNDLPDDYRPREVIRLLNGYRDRILAVRGNCEAEVDQMVLEFPVMADYALLPAGNRLIYITHGHLAGEDSPPPLRRGDILLAGHTHVPGCVKHETFIYMNPGSVSMPKEGSPRGYMIFSEGTFVWKELSGGKAYMEYKITGDE